MDKPALRKRLRSDFMRNGNIRKRSERVISHLIELERYKEAVLIGAYWAIEGEVSTERLFLHCKSRKKRFFLPRCEGSGLFFAEIADRSELEVGGFGILVPSKSASEDPKRRGDPNSFDMLIVPGVGFDRTGGRLGRGRGYYDRLLGSLSGETLVVGLAFESQIVSEVPTEPHDAPVDLLVSEKGVYDCGRERNA